MLQLRCPQASRRARLLFLSSFLLSATRLLGLRGLPLPPQQTNRTSPSNVMLQLSCAARSSYSDVREMCGVLSESLESWSARSACERTRKKKREFKFFFFLRGLVQVPSQRHLNGTHKKHTAKIVQSGSISRSGDSLLMYTLLPS